jgi:hypothetical protein
MTTFAIFRLSSGLKDAGDLDTRLSEDLLGSVKEEKCLTERLELNGGSTLRGIE